MNYFTRTQWALILTYINLVLLNNQTPIWAAMDPSSQSMVTFNVETYDGLILPAQVIEPANASNKLVIFINGSTPYDEKGHIGASWDANCKIITKKHDFYLRFLDIISMKGYNIATMAKRSFVYPCKIPRPSLDELALDIQFFIWQLKNRSILNPERELIIIGYSEGSIVATKLLGLLKEKPTACILLGSGTSHFNFKEKSWQEWYMVDVIRKKKGWTDKQIQKEYEEFGSIMMDLVTTNEEIFENKTKQTKSFGFGFAPWESYYIDREIQFYNCVPNLLESNVPILICIGENDIAMPKVVAERTYEELLKNGYDKATFRVIEDEVHEYKKYDVFAIMDAWLDSNGETTEFVLEEEDKYLKDKYDNLVDLRNCIASLSWEGGEPEKSLDCFQKVKSAQYENPMQWFELGVKLFANGHNSESYEAFTQAIDSSFIAHFAAMTWLGHILDLRNQRDQAIQWYNKALAQYPGFPVQHDQWGIIIDKKWIEERLKTPFKFEKK